jgi:S-ribosylhomocysteine lyase LuxS involved in autoinducer biosynthesis
MSQTIELVHKLDDIQKCDLRLILPNKDYSKRDIDECSDLLSKML